METNSMCCIASVALTVGHPGIFFKPMLANGHGQDYPLTNEKNMIGSPQANSNLE